MLFPMLASLADAPLDDPNLVHEPKYDGIRAIVEIAPKGHVRLWSRLGNEKTQQFPAIVAALEKWAKARTQPLVLDGEIVALDANGQPAGFQQLQGGSAATALIAFDVLRDGKTDYRDRPLTERRAALETLFKKTGSPLLRISDQVRGDGRALYTQALEQGWEGLIAKHAASLYKSGKRSPDWRKLKIVHEQEFVIGGWTDPKGSRERFGALLVGYWHRERLRYAGKVGTGFDRATLERLGDELERRERPTTPFAPDKFPARARWAEPELVAEVGFTAAEIAKLRKDARGFERNGHSSHIVIDTRIAGFVARRTNAVIVDDDYDGVWCVALKNGFHIMTLGFADMMASRIAHFLDGNIEGLKVCDEKLSEVRFGCGQITIVDQEGVPTDSHRQSTGHGF